MEYRSQKIAYWYFAIALLLFTLQVVLGLWLAYSYSFTVPQWIVDKTTLPPLRASVTGRVTHVFVGQMSPLAGPTLMVDMSTAKLAAIVWFADTFENVYGDTGVTAEPSTSRPDR